MGETFKTAACVDFRSLFLVPFGVAVAAAVVLALFFHPPDPGRAGEKGACVGQSSALQTSAGQRN